MIEQIIHHSVSRLSDRERNVISMRYGLNGGDGMTFEGIANRLGVTRERVRQVCNRSLRLLRRHKELREISDYFDESYVPERTFRKPPVPPPDGYYWKTYHYDPSKWIVDEWVRGFKFSSNGYLEETEQCVPIVPRRWESKDGDRWYPLTWEVASQVERSLRWKRWHVTAKMRFQKGRRLIWFLSDSANPDICWMVRHDYGKKTRRFHRRRR